MRNRGLFVSFVLVGLCAGLIGCGSDEKKSGDGGSPTGDPKEKGPDGQTPDGTPPPAPGEPKFKVAAEDFIKEYTTNSRAANAKYSGAIVELKGSAMKPAAIEMDDFGSLVGDPGSYKAILVFGTPEARRSELVIVRGLKLSNLGKILHGQVVRVKGKVTSHRDPNPVVLTDGEIVDAGTDPSVPLDYKRFRDPDGKEYLAKFANAPARASGTVVARGKDVTDFVIVRLDSNDNVRFYLMPGTDPLYPSGFEPGAKVSFVGMLRQRAIDKGTPLSGITYVVDDAIVQHKDPKAKLD